jgi:hypothetical protein
MVRRNGVAFATKGHLQTWPTSSREESCPHRDNTLPRIAARLHYAEVGSSHTPALMSHRTRWETPTGRYDENNSKFSLSMKPKFNRPVGERNHFWRLLLADFWQGALPTSVNNVEPAQNTTKILCPNLQWGCQSHWFCWKQRIKRIVWKEMFVCNEMK